MIYVECYADLALVKSLTNLPRKEIAHEFKGKGGICGRLREKPHRLGVVDEDPSKTQPRYIKETKLVQDFPAHGIRVLHHSSSNNYLIVLCPYLEVWILAAANEATIDVGEYSLPKDAKKLRETIKFDSRKFEKLLSDLTNSARLKSLKAF